MAILLFGGARLAPVLWQAMEDFRPDVGYRIPYELSHDYWLPERWCRYAGDHYPALIVGDSVVWGQYVTPHESLSGHLNRMAGAEVFANVGVDGLHPAAIRGLVTHFCSSIASKGVILHLNLLWMSSLRHDLSDPDRRRFNHAGLVPQFLGRPACYRPKLDEAIAAILDRSTAFFSLASHLRLTRLEGMNVQTWTLQNPYTNPFSGDAKLSEPDDAPRGKPISWVERGISLRDLPWVSASASYQWAAFRDAVEILRGRDNEVLVLVGPFNRGVLSDDSPKRYRALRAQMEAWLDEQGVAYHVAAELPSELYADASHPLAEGYRLLAEDLTAAPVYQDWLTRLGRESTAARPVEQEAEETE